MIELKNVTVERTGNSVLNDVNISFRDNEVAIILGPSGAGKSSILKVILGLWKPKSGEVIINGKDIAKMPEKELNKMRKKIGMVFQSNALFDSFTVEQNVGYFLRDVKKISEKEIRKIVAESIELVNLKGSEKLFPEELSEGMKKRVAIARSIAVKPDIILYDEPTTGLDPVNSKVVVDLVKEISATGKTSIVVTHIMKDAVEMGDTFSFVYKGNILASGTSEAIFNSSHDVIKTFFANENLSELKTDINIK